jgi:UDP-N-acetyl-D-glucosamine dehydrogenase
MEFYSSICEELVSVSTPEIAEAAKLLENTFRLVNIALVNELATLCSGTGISVYEVIEAASTKPYGFMPFRPSVGVGGHCIPIDPLYLTWWAQQHGVDAPLISAADHINRLMPNFVATRALSFVDIEIKTPRVLILGVAYKPGVGDVRETPASELRRCLIEMGAIVAWYDPLVPEWEDSNSVEIDWECDIAILAINQVGIDVEPLIQRGVTVLDCTNSILNRSGVNQL